MYVIINYLDDMLFFIGIAFPLIVVWRLFRWKKRGFQLKEFLHELGILVFFSVLVGLFSQTIIPKIGEVPAYTTGVNLELFRVVKETYNAIVYLGFWQPFYINFLGNIILFIPIGFLLPLLFSKMEFFIFPILTGLCISLFIEIMQLPQSRSSDVDDLWLNTLGAFLGYLCYFFIRKAFPSFTKAFKKSL
ncbi:VanZ family protein [Psychrobacillus psychrodurans]|uniref:VanZ family protein n=1 Tax=Psychrobacillus TaxID=1221880 RepID=UPI0008E22D2A|nr:VanZ family protein [Psychrobacillus psychrodurans]MCK1997630.1 VanZ family protein [Psychrobacillus psychrodurans]MCZ8540595.1 VanZ family protein [Psychrobacillus psychrodurans]SFM66749.1 VanZ like family protein [Psychrobacillus psychrodurans]